MASRLTFGTIDSFNPDNKTIVTYLERVEMFFAANDIADDKKVPVLLSLLGGKIYALLRSLVSPSLPKEKTFVDLSEVLKKHFEPKNVIIAEWLKFHHRDQAEGESITKYIAVLRNIATHCSFGDNLNEALRDRFVCGIHSEAIQKRLLTVSDLTFAKVVEISEGMETAAITCQVVKCKVLTTGLIQQVTDSALKRKWAVKDNYYRRCYRCGRENHIAPDCKFKNAICYDCGKGGHIASVCYSRKEGYTKQAARKVTFKHQERVHTMEMDEPVKTELPLFKLEIKVHAQLQ